MAGAGERERARQRLALGRVGQPGDEVGPDALDGDRSVEGPRPRPPLRARRAPSPTSLTDGGRRGVELMITRLSPRGRARRAPPGGRGHGVQHLPAGRVPLPPRAVASSSWTRSATPCGISEGADETGLRRRRAGARRAHRPPLRGLLRGVRGRRRRRGGRTSAARDAANGEEAMRALSADGRPDVRVLSAEEEAWYGYLGAVNSTTLGDGHVLDLGGGSVQVTQVRGRALRQAVSRPLGAVRMTERYLPGPRPPARRPEAAAPQGRARSWPASTGSRAPAGGWWASAAPSARCAACTSARSLRARRAPRLPAAPRRPGGADRRDARAARVASAAACRG